MLPRVAQRPGSAVAFLQMAIDPLLVQAFQRCARGFENIFRELPEETASVGPSGGAAGVVA
jgi:hypothetical protein